MLVPCVGLPTFVRGVPKLPKLQAAHASLRETGLANKPKHAVSVLTVLKMQLRLHLQSNAGSLTEGAKRQIRTCSGI